MNLARLKMCGEIGAYVYNQYLVNPANLIYSCCTSTRTSLRDMVHFCTEINNIHKYT